MPGHPKIENPNIVYRGDLSHDPEQLRKLNEQQPGMMGMVFYQGDLDGTVPDSVCVDVQRGLVLLTMNDHQEVAIGRLATENLPHLKKVFGDATEGGKVPAVFGVYRLDGNLERTDDSYNVGFRIKS